MRTSYSEKDVILLLKDITGLVQPQSAEERERLIQSGRHYCEMLPIEYVPSEKYMEAYQSALRHFSAQTAKAIGVLADKIMQKRGKNVVLVSLARAGIPIGILLKRYIQKKYALDAPHYSISIIRGRGIDENAIKYLLKKYAPQQLLFVDGWIGKGAILGELEKDVQKFNGISPQLAVVADPANMTDLCGTHEDILIPSSCLNSTVSGLVSRTFLREDIIGPEDFHGAVYYGELKDVDLSYPFIEAIEKKFIVKEINCPQNTQIKFTYSYKGIDEVKQIAEKYQIDDINLIKPGIGETTRVLLRRVPWKVLIGETCKEDISLEHLKQLALEKNVPVEYYPLKNYKACGIIKKLADT
jgi:ribosomal protein L7Ae-like RNA K-turn-binding protein